MASEITSGMKAPKDNYSETLQPIRQDLATMRGGIKQIAFITFVDYRKRR